MMDKPHMTEPLSATLPFALLLTLANSFLDSYTYLARGHVFATAQTRIIDNSASSRRAAGVYASLIVTFAVGALVGAFSSRLLDVHAIWLPAALLVLTLAMLVIDEYRRRRG
jgi:uncharacterized membrane protein YoaK (UPF0700 family)